MSLVFTARSHLSIRTVDSCTKACATDSFSLMNSLAFTMYGWRHQPGWHFNSSSQKNKLLYPGRAIVQRTRQLGSVFICAPFSPLRASHKPRRTYLLKVMYPALFTRIVNSSSQTHWPFHDHTSPTKACLVMLLPNQNWILCRWIIITTSELSTVIFRLLSTKISLRKRCSKVTALSNKGWEPTNPPE